MLTEWAGEETRTGADRTLQRSRRSVGVFPEALTRFFYRKRLTPYIPLQNDSLALLMETLPATRHLSAITP